MCVARTQPSQAGTFRAPCLASAGPGRDGLKRCGETLLLVSHAPARPSRESPIFSFVFLIAKSNFFPFVQSRGRLYDAASVYVKRLLTTLSGGSLGSCVDEERSQLRELM